MEDKSRAHGDGLRLHRLRRLRRLDGLCESLLSNALNVQEMAAKPLNQEECFNFIFAIHNGSDRNQLLLGQWRSWIIAINGDDYDHR